MPSTERCSSESSRRTSGRFSTAAMSRAATPLLSSRSRFFDKVEWSQTGSSTPEPDEPADFIERLGRMKVQGMTLREKSELVTRLGFRGFMELLGVR